MKKLDCIVPDEPGLIASKGEYMALAFAVRDEDGNTGYVFNVCKGHMPPYHGTIYVKKEDLIEKMIDFQPDFRKWRVNTE